MNIELHELPLEDFQVSVVMPVLSETGTVCTIVDWLRANLGRRLLEVIIVISPRAPEATRSICEQLACSDPSIRVQEQQENPGVGRAFRQGYASVRGNVVLSMDSDGEMELETIPSMIAAMAGSNLGLVVGSRWLPGGGFVGYSPAKKRLNWTFQQLFRIVFRTQLHDLTYGFKLMRTELVRNIGWEATLHEIGCETTLRVIHLGIPVAEVPTTWRARQEGRSSNNFLRNFRYVGMAVSILLRGSSLRPREDRSEVSQPERHPRHLPGARKPMPPRLLADPAPGRVLE